MPARRYCFSKFYLTSKNEKKRNSIEKIDT